MKLIDLLSSALKAHLQNCVSICFPGIFSGDVANTCFVHGQVLLAPSPSCPWTLYGSFVKYKELKIVCWAPLRPSQASKSKPGPINATLVPPAIKANHGLVA